MKPTSCHICRLLFALIVVGLASACATGGSTASSPPPPPVPVTEAPPPAKTIAESEVKAALEAFVKSRADEGSTLQLSVLQEGQVKEMRLKFVKILDPVAVLNPSSAMACAEFVETKKTKRSKKKVTSYDIDFWLAPGPDGKLTVIPEKTEVHKMDGKKLFDYDRTGNKIPVG